MVQGASPRNMMMRTAPTRLMLGGTPSPLATSTLSSRPPRPPVEEETPFFGLPEEPEPADEPESRPPSPRGPGYVNLDPDTESDADEEEAQDDREYNTRRRGGSGAAQPEYTAADIAHLRALWNGDAHINSPRCTACGSVIVAGAAYCEVCGTALFDPNDDDDLANQAADNFQRVSDEFGLIWHWVLRGRTGLRLPEGKDSWKLLKRARNVGFVDIISRFVEDSQFRYRMITERGWDEQGVAARRADELALIPREAAEVSYEERERRNYWRQTATNRPQSGRDSVRTGYIAPGTPVPGATPSGGKSSGKRSFQEASWHWGDESSSSSAGRGAYTRRRSWWACHEGYH